MTALKRIILTLSCFLLIAMIVSSYGTLKPPASVITTVFRMTFQIVLKYLVPALAGILFLYCSYSWYMIRRHRRKPQTYTVGIMLIYGFCLFGSMFSYLSITDAYARKSQMNYEQMKAGKDRPNIRDTYQMTDLSEVLQVSQCQMFRSEVSEYRDTAVIYLNYGGWSLQDDSYGKQIYEFCRKEGYTFVRYGCDRLEDEKIDALIRKNNEGLVRLQDNQNFSKIYLLGGSAGGHMALLCGQLSADNAFATPVIKVDGIIAFYSCVNPGAAYDYYVSQDDRKKHLIDHAGDWLYCTLFHGSTNTLGAETRKLDDAVFGERTEDNWLYDQTDVDRMIETSEIPILLVHGSLDSMAPVEQVRSYYKQLSEKQKRAVYLELPGTEHVFDLMPTLAWERCEEEMSGFIRYINQ